MKKQQTNTPNSTFPIDSGRIFPYDLKAEESVLSALMLEPYAFRTVESFLQPDDFYRDEHRMIFEAIRAVAATKPVDVTLVADELARSGNLEQAGGMGNLAEIFTKTVSALNLKNHAGIVKYHAVSRKLILFAGEISNLCFDATNDIHETLEYAGKQLQLISEEITGKSEYQSLPDVLTVSRNNVFDRMDRFQKGLPVGIPTGIADLNNAIGGWRNGNLIILAARPSMGKTALCLHFAKRAAKSGIPVALFSLEMTAESLGDRLILSELSGVNANDFRLGKLSPENVAEIEKSIGRLYGYKIYIDSNSGVTMSYIRQQARKLKKENKCGLVIIDYLQLANSAPANKNQTRNNEVSEMSKMAKQIARELNVPVILLSQLNRESEKSKDKRPMLSNLRDSGSIEQDADIVILIHREFYYSKSAYDQGKGELIIAKARDGETKTVFFRHNESMTQIFDAYKTDYPFPVNNSSDVSPF